jgi:glycerol-3-phosphate dehydrogenase
MEMTEGTIVPAVDIPRGPFDVIVVGAGINGTGIARDAARRGLNVLLLDKSDIAAGTTSWSSRLIHGGLRYLEHGEIPLVYESLQERERLLHIAPHLVRPLPLTLPIYGYHKRGALTIRAGMIAYDALSWNKSLPRHRMFSRDGALAHEPGLNPDNLKAAARYYDAQVEFPERISVENSIDAVTNGATVLTNAQVDGLVLEAGVVRGVHYTELASGKRHTVRGTIVVNVAGPWVDNVLAEAGLGSPKRPMLGVTKGTHIVVEPFPGAPTDAMYIEARSDGRPYFIIPWNDLYLIGTTDDRYEGDLDNVVPTEEEIAYLLSETSMAIPASGLTRDSVRYAYAGLRPLPNQDGAESGITRKHIIHNHAPRVQGLLSIIGGKLTTFRNLSEQTVDKVGEMLGRSLPASTTGEVPLPGAPNKLAVFARNFSGTRPDWLSEQSASYLVRIYGTRATSVLAMAEENADLRPVISQRTGAIGAAIAFAFAEEYATSLTDAIMRRTMIGYNADAGFDSLEGITGIARTALAWDNERTTRELKEFRKYMARFLPRAAAN